jgi:hypothetical protein
VSTVLKPSAADRRDLAPQAAPTDGTNSSWRICALAAPAIAALILWRLSLLHINVSNLGDYGLPPALPIAWYVALVLAIVGTVTAATMRRTSGLIMVASIVVVAIILYGTVPVLSAQPHYAWVYKHIGVVRYLEAHEKVNPSIDIYNRWPGFFALGAMFSTVGGSPNPETYASWAELFFLLLDVFLLMAAVKAITRDLRIAVGAALFFILANWVGQTYYSPQAFAFVLGLALITIMFRQLRVTGSTYSGRLTRLIERLGHVSQLPVPTDDTARWPHWAAITAVLGLDAIIVASHQLTPYMLLIGIALLMLCGIVRPWWVLVGMGVMTLAYLAANFHFIQHNYGVFSSFDPFNNAQDSTTPEVPLAGKVFNTDVELLLIAALWLGALCSMARLLRRGLLARALPFVVLAVSPFVVIFGQNYGGEVSLRIILFSSPWCAALIAWALTTVDRRRLKWAMMTFLALLFAALFVPSFLGQEELNIISPAEVRASEWFYYHAPRRTVLVLAAPGFPYRYGGTYSEFKGPEGDANPNLVTSAIFQSRQLGPSYVPRVARKIEEYSKHGYIVFTKDETAYAQVMGLTPTGALAQLEAAVAQSPQFRLWYANSDAQIYELVVRPKGSRKATKGRHETRKAPPRRSRDLRRAVRRSKRVDRRTRLTKKADRRQS